MSTAPLRQELEDLIRRDLLGPAGGEQEIITEQSVRDRYLLGMLAPLKVIEVDEERVAPLEECDAPSQPITLGATNMWFSRTLSALSIPSSADPLEQLAEQDLTALFEDAESERDVKLVRRGHARYDPYTDAQIWAAIGKLRAQDSAAPLTPKDLKLPEWKLFSKPDPAKNSANLRLRVVTPPAKYAPWIESVVLIDRLREVQALAGFTRLEPAGDDSAAKLVPLRRGPAEWVPAAEVRGEGLFLRLSEAKVSDWLATAPTLEMQFFGAHRRWRAQRGLDPSLGFPGLRYVLLHPLAHALIRQFSVECGYAAASLRERIYSSTPDDEESMAGILIYTAAPDSEGTLGGLVTLGETANLEQHLDQALESLRSAHLTHCARRRHPSKRSCRCMAPPATTACFCRRLRASGVTGIWIGPYWCRPWSAQSSRSSAHDNRRSVPQTRGGTAGQPG